MTRNAATRMAMAITLATAPASPTAFGAVGGNTVDSLLAIIDTTETHDAAATANEFFAELSREKVTDSQMVFSSTTPANNLRGLVWFWAAEYYFARGEYAATLDYCDRALPMLAQGHDRQTEGDCLTLQTVSHSIRHEWDDAMQTATRAVALAREEQDSSMLCSALSSMASIMVAQGDLKKAETYLVEALGCEKFLTDAMKRCRFYGIANTVNCALRRDALALSFAEDGVAEAEKSGNECLKGMALIRRGAALANMRQYERAKESLREAAEIFRNDGNSYQLGVCSNAMGDISLRQGDAETASGFFREAAAVFRRHGDTLNQCRALMGLYKSTPADKEQAKAEIAAQYDTLAKGYNSDIDSGRRQGQRLRSIEETEAKERHRTLVSVAELLGVLLLVGLGIATAVHFLRKKRRNAGLRHTVRRAMIILARWLTPRSSSASALTESDRTFLTRLAREVRLAMKNNQKVEEKAIASRMRISQTQLRLRTLNIVGEGASTYIMKLRIAKARQLMDNTCNSTKEVAQSCGYTDYKDFEEDFETVMNMTPAAYKKQRGA